MPRREERPMQERDEVGWAGLILETEVDGRSKNERLRRCLQRRNRAEAVHCRADSRSRPRKRAESRVDRHSAGALRHTLPSRIAHMALAPLRIRPDAASIASLWAGPCRAAEPRSDGNSSCRSAASWSPPDWPKSACACCCRCRASTISSCSTPNSDSGSSPEPSSPIATSAAIFPTARPARAFAAPIFRPRERASIRPNAACCSWVTRSSTRGPCARKISSESASRASCRHRSSRCVPSAYVATTGEPRSSSWRCAATPSACGRTQSCCCSIRPMTSSTTRPNSPARPRSARETTCART